MKPDQPAATAATDKVAADPNRADVFPVTVEAIVAFVTSPLDAFAAITRDVRTGGSADRLGEGINYSFTYGGIRHDVRLSAAED